jgi:hypothetical protein
MSLIAQLDSPSDHMPEQQDEQITIGIDTFLRKSGDPNSTARHKFYEPCFFKNPECLSDRRPADSKVFRHFLFQESVSR